ncbi:MAG: class I SAM-dependent methyltransferase [Methanoregula sp.]|jgi:ubiquinone/menaquinone biosynthesis C-methylase UbiE|uniref:class I SAM-dependent methyltransferase n=1 Tax=Methanoregula sp. TaxID=2052170 RepID=UPI003C1E0F56
MNIENKYDKAKTFWSKIDCSVTEKNFYSFPPIRSRSSNLIFKESDAIRRDWCEYWTVEKYLKDQIPFDKVLSICCGFGHVERVLSKLNIGKIIIGTDIALGAIEKAIKRAKDENIGNIQYYASDIQKEKLPINEYDLIWANGALHHIQKLDQVIPMLYNALKPGGFLISNEYVGPNYQQISPRHEELVNAIIHMLPPELQENPYNNYLKAKSIKGKGYELAKFFIAKIYHRNQWKKKPISYYIKNDPSECVNSERIIPTLKQVFR